MIKLDNVSAGYQSKPVFTHLNLDIAEGQFAGIVGPTGTGKTTLLKTILGAHIPHAGQVIVQGKPVKKLRPGTIGYVPQLETVDWQFPVTAEQVVLMGLYGTHTFIPWTTKLEKKKVAELAEKLNISDILHHHIRDLSGGQQQRVFLARALVSNPRLLVLDEPTSGVDMKTQHDVLHLLGHLNEEGITIIITTHDLNAVASHLPWVICFNQTIIAQGKPDDIFVPEILSKTYGGDLGVVRHDGHLLIVHNPHSH